MLFASSGKNLKEDSNYENLAKATKEKKLLHLQVLSIPGSRSTLLNFILGGANLKESTDKFIPLHEPFIQGGDPFVNLHAKKTSYDVYVKAIKRINTAFEENSVENKNIGLTVKDHCHCFTTGEKHVIDEKMFCEYIRLANAGVILTIREPIAVFNNRFRALLNFKLTEKGGLDSESIFTAFFQNDCEKVHKEILELLKQEKCPIDESRLLKELGKNSIEEITIDDWNSFRIRFFKEKADAFRLAWTKAKEIYELLNKHNIPVIIVNTSEMCKEPEKYLRQLMENIPAAEFHMDMINNIPKKELPYRYNYAGEEYGHDRITNIFLRCSLISTAIIKEEKEKRCDPNLLPKEILDTLSFVNEIYSFLNSHALKCEPEKVFLNEKTF